MIHVYPSRVRADASALVVYSGAANRTLTWTLGGSGTLTPLSSRTDARGQAAARYEPGNEGETITFEVIAGA